MHAVSSLGSATADIKIRPLCSAGRRLSFRTGRTSIWVGFRAESTIPTDWALCRAATKSPHTALLAHPRVLKRLPTSCFGTDSSSPLKEAHLHKTAARSLVVLLAKKKTQVRNCFVRLQVCYPAVQPRGLSFQTFQVLKGASRYRRW